MTIIRIAVFLLGSLSSSFAIAVEAPAAPKLSEQAATAVDKGLAWLAKNQAENGSWGVARSDVATTSLAVRAFLARGHRPGKGDYGAHMNKGIDYVLASSQKDGMLSRSQGNDAMYEHGFALLMLAQVRGVVDETRQMRISEVVKAGVALTLKAQSVRKDRLNDGGLRYQKTSPDSDISVTGAHMIALYAAAAAPDVTVPKEAIRAGQDFAMRCRFKGGAGFTYQPGAGVPGQARTAIALVVLQPSGHWQAAAAGSGDILMGRPMTNPYGSFYYYSVYYMAQAYHFLGGKYLDEGFSKLRDGILAVQEKDGHWEKAVGQEVGAGPAYRTSMAVLALCTPLTTSGPPTRPAE